MKYLALNGWTKEEILSMIRDNFSGVSIDNQGSCMYRGPAGKMCGVGCFIPNELYSENMENKTVEQLMRDHKNLEAVMPLPLGALNSIQEIHDNYGDFHSNIDNVTELRDENVLNQMLKFVIDNVCDESLQCPVVLSLK